MKKTVLIAFLALGATLTSFDSPEQFLPTKLRVTVRDHMGNLVSGATVTLYRNEDNYRDNENPVQSATTNEKGYVDFKDLEPKSYFVDVRKGEMNNDGAGSKTSTLAPKKTNMVTIIIE
jgi:protocatechuate 3,4-dioxygenase beta subunit